MTPRGESLFNCSDAGACSRGATDVRAMLDAGVSTHNKALETALWWVLSRALDETTCRKPLRQTPRSYDYYRSN